MSISKREYWAEISAIARAVSDESHRRNLDEDDVYDLLDRTIDNHEWIQPKNFYDVLKHSNNAGAYIDETGADPTDVMAVMNREEAGHPLNNLLTVFAAYAMIYDVLAQDEYYA